MVDQIRAIRDFCTSRGIQTPPLRDERIPGRPGDFTPIGFLDHHTASAATSGDIPSLGLLKNGRLNPDGSVLSAPVVQTLVGRHTGIIVAISDGRSNHAGNGWGPALDRIRQGLPPVPPGSDTTGGTQWFWGMEIENNGVGESYGALTLNSVTIVNAAICWAHGWNPASALLGHREWTRRKIDPTYDMAWMRSQTAALINGQSPTPIPTPPPPEDDMPTMEELRKDDQLHSAIAKKVVEATGGLLSGQGVEWGRNFPEDAGRFVSTNNKGVLNLGDIYNLLHSLHAQEMAAISAVGVGNVDTAALASQFATAVAAQSPAFAQAVLDALKAELND